MSTPTTPSAAAPTTWREFQFSDGSSNKFWRIQLDDTSFTVQYGRLGTQGQEQTKAFDDAAKAKKEYDKLVAEKLKKGYVESGGPASSAEAAPTSAAPAKVAAKKSATPKSKAPQSDAAEATSPVVAASPADHVSTRSSSRDTIDVKHELRLEPTDWFWAMWRDPDPLPRPEPPEFDQSERIARIRKARGGYHFEAETVIRATNLSPQEARFWLASMTTVTGAYGDDHRKQLATKLETTDLRGEWNLDHVKELLSSARADQCAEVTLCLGCLFSPLEIYDLIVGDWTVTDYRGTRNDVTGWAQWMIPGFHQYVLPYLSRLERESLQTHAKKFLKQLPIPAHDDESANWAAWMFGGILGLHDEVEKVVNAWPDEAFHQRHQSYSRILVLMGLRNGGIFRQQWRRLGLHVNDFDRYGGWGRPAAGSWIRAWLAHTEFTDLDMIRDGILAQTNKEGCEVLLKTFAQVVDAAEAAPTMLELSQTSKTPRIARVWLEERVATSVAGLIPPIVQKDKLADDAIVFLQDQQHAGHAELIEAQIATLAAEQAQIVRQAIAGTEGKTFEPLTEATTPKWLADGLAEASKRAVPDFVAIRRLPPITLEGKKLTDEQTQRLLVILQKASFDKPIPLFELLRQHADRGSLDAFVWNLFEQWLVEADSKQKWAMLALGQLGGDLIALKLTPLLRKWPGESQHQRSVTGLECLRAIGSDTALMQLNGVAQKVKFKGIKQKAQEFMEQIAQQKGLSRAQLEDRIVPDCDLDERGSRTFDFGPRKFFFRLSNDMKPLVRDENKKLLKDLPKPGANDDPVKAEAAVAEWKVLKGQLREVLKIQAGRLEQAMVVGRRWPIEEFESFLVKHPLMTNLARTVIWGAYDAQGKLKQSFRVTEEQDYANVKDQPYELKGVQDVGIVHPLNLDEDTSRAWGEILGDYEVVAPFPQFGRAVYALDPDEKDATELKRFHGLKLPAPTLVFTLEKLGWLRGEALDGGGFCDHLKQFDGSGVTAIVSYDGGVGMGYIDPNEIVTITNVQFMAGMHSTFGHYWGRKESFLHLSEVPPVVVSEVIAELTGLAAKGK